jgi:sec-independent protein translocase protein TatC
VAAASPALNGQGSAPDSAVEGATTAVAPRDDTPSSVAAEPTALVPSEPPSSPPPPAVPTSDGGFPSPEDEEEEGMTMLEHLEELRIRIIICCVALATGMAISALPVPFTEYRSLTWNVIDVVAKPAAGHLQYLQPGESFITYFKVAMALGGALAMPVIIYQMMAFVLPALHPHEKKYLFMAAPGVAISFIIGVLFGYLLLLPVAINFLLTFGTDTGIEAMWGFGYYVGTVTSLLFWMGMSFQTPLIMFFLTKLRVLNVDRLKRFRKYALILSFVIGAIITPTPDPLNQTIVSLPLYLLYELGLLLARLA